MRKLFAAALLALSMLGACSSEQPAAPRPMADAAPAPGKMDAAGGTGMPADSGSPAVDAAAPATDAAAPATDAAGPGADAPLAPADSAPASDAAPGTWPLVIDYGARGPFAITRQMNTGPGGGYDIFRPAQLGAEGRKHPIVSWTNGTLFGLTDYQKLLEHWASHGLVVIAGRTNTTAGGGTHKAGIDWLVAENARAGSPFAGLLDTAKIGAAGHSQGGGATIAAGANKPGATGIVATIPLMALLRFESDETVVGRQAAPMLNIVASMDDRDPTGAVAKTIFDGAPGAMSAALVQATFGGIHEDAMNAAMFKPTLAWFRLHLMGDTGARALFYPAASCGLCQDPAWRQVRYKPLP